MEYVRLASPGTMMMMTRIHVGEQGIQRICDLGIQARSDWTLSATIGSADDPTLATIGEQGHKSESNVNTTISPWKLNSAIVVAF